jgi:bifunctional NMN adenylyltransferase/nudix hydrolase
MQYTYDHLIFIGRFQPPHNGHLQVILHALTLAQHVVVVIGSANKPRSVRNPFTDAERLAMILAAVADADASAAGRLRFVSVRDYYDDVRWLAAVEDAVSSTIGEAAGRVGVIGHLKDASSAYLRGFRRWPLVEVQNTQGLSSTDLRAVFFSSSAEAADRDGLANAVPPAVLAFLEAFSALPAFQELVDAHAWVQRERAKWPRTPYPVIGNTVDAVVRCKGHVLMIKRRDHPGRGLWALPGGYVEEYEPLKTAVLRELEEETQLGMKPPQLEAHLRAAHTFDYPWRSQRGRVITQGYYFDLDLPALPRVSGGDDAAEARWIAQAELPGLEASIHDDHLHIIEHFLSSGA